MGKTSVPKRGKAAKTRPLRSDASTKGMPKIALGKASKKSKIKPVIAKTGKVKFKPVKAKRKVKPGVDADDSDTASVASARVKRNTALDNGASTSKAPNESSDSKGPKSLKGQKPTKASSDRSASPATSRLSRSSSASSVAGKVSEVRKGGKIKLEKGKKKSVASASANKSILNYFTQKLSPSSKVSPVGKKKSTGLLKKGSVGAGTALKKVVTSTNSSPDSVNSVSSRSNLVPSERSEINDDDLSVLDDEESCVESHSEDLDVPCATNGVEDASTKAIPKLTRKNINELFPSDDSTIRLRSGSPASQKSTRSLTLQRNSPKSVSGSSLLSTAMSESAVRLLRNGQQNKLKRASLFESTSKKKKRVYAGALKDEDKVEDSRSDFSDEQSSIFSESDSSSFIDTFARIKSSEVDDKIDVGDIPGSMSNDEDDINIGRIGSPIEKNSNVSKTVKVDGKSKAKSMKPSGNAPTNKNSEKCGKHSSKNDILNNIQSDWDSDGGANEEETDVWAPDSPKEGRFAFDDLLSNSGSSQLAVKDSFNENNSSENLGLNKDSDSENNLSEMSDLNKDADNDNNSSEKLDLSKNSVNENNSSIENSDSNIIVKESEKFDEKEEMENLSSLSPTDSSHEENQLSVDPDSQSSDQPESVNGQSKLPEPIVLKTAENKNCFAESVDFVAKKNTKIDFELLRRRTKRSMSFNTDASEKSQSQRILTIEPTKVQGLVWTVKAVRDPIIPKSIKSAEKKLSKSDSQENRNISPVKPMMESTQNDQVTQSPKVAPDNILASPPFSVNSSSVKENILMQTSPKQSPGKSPVREAVFSGNSPKSVTVSPIKEYRSESCANGGLEKEKSLSISSQPRIQPSAQSPQNSSTKQVSSDNDSVVASNPGTTFEVNATSSDNQGVDVCVAAAAKTPIDESSPVVDPEVPCLPPEQKEETSQAATQRCSTPDSDPPVLQKNMEVTPEKTNFDDDSFSLRLSPTPTKEESVFRNNCVSSPKAESLLGSPPQPTSREEEILNLDSTQDDAKGTHDLDTQVPEENKQSEETSNQSKPNDIVPPKIETQTLQLIRKKGASRPRSLSVDCNPSSLTFISDSVWVLKNDQTSPKLASLEEKITEIDKGETEVKDKAAAKNQDVQLEIHTSTTQVETENNAESTNVKDDGQADMTVECASSRVKQVGLLSPRLEADVERLNLELNDIEKKRREITEEEQSPEKKAIKERILSSLGLQSVSAAAAAAASGTGRPSKRRSQDGIAPSSGRLKAVIKLPKDSKRDKKSDRKPLRMVFKNGKPHPGGLDDGPSLGRTLDSDSSLRLEGNNGLETSVNPLFNGSEYPSNGSLALLDASAPASEGDGKGKTGANLVIPEKSSSFSIHPGRLCSDVCSYCFGKFGSLDTPCHVAQLKSRERQMKIMSVETHLALDSCLCDACIRYVDRKANCPSSKPQTTHRKDSKSKFEGSMATCSVTGCIQPARHSLRKKWYIKIRKSVLKKCPIDLELAHQHLPLPLCPEHFSYMEYFMVCGLCKRRLSRNHMYNLTNTHEINICLEHDGIPARLSDKLFVCKLCRYYATLRVKHPRSHISLSSNQREFFNSYRKRILSSHDIEASDSEADGRDAEAHSDEAGPEDAPSLLVATLPTPTTSAATTEESLPKGKRKRAGSNATAPLDVEAGEQPKKKSRHSDQPGKSKEKTDGGKARARSREREPVPPVTICVSDVNKGLKVGKVGRKQTAEHAAAMSMVRKGHAPFFPAEDELALHAQFQFQFDDEPSANRVWEKCTSTLQFDKDTKKLWQELQRPYGSQSSFLRHLVLMERYWREGELVLATDASAKATSYTRSVQNRLKAYGSTITVKSTPEAPKPPPAPAPAPPQASATASTPVSAAAPALAPLARVSRGPSPHPPSASLSLALTGDTVLTAAAAAAAVTAVHTAPLPSPTGDAALQAPPKLQAKQPQSKAQQAKQPAKSQQGKSQQAKAQQTKSQQAKAQLAKAQQARAKGQQGKQQNKSQPTIHVKPVAVLQSMSPAIQTGQAPQQSVKSTQSITVTVKPPEAAISTKQQLSSSQVAISIASHPQLSITSPVSVSSAVTITPEPSPKTNLDKPSSASAKLQPILPKPLSTAAASKSSSPSSSFSLGPRGSTPNWETTSPAPTGRQSFIPLSSAPVVNLTRSISLTAVPSTPPLVPDLHPINPQNPRPNRSPSASLPLSVNSMSVLPSRGTSSAYVSITPTSSNKAVYSTSPSQSCNKPASITPIYTSQSQSLTTPLSVTPSSTSTSSVSSTAVSSNENSSGVGKVQVTAGGKSFYLTIQQFKKLQALRQQRQLEQRKKLKVQSTKQDKDTKTSSSSVTSVEQKSDLEVVEVRDSDSETLPTISAVCSGDQAKAMWNDESRNLESDPNISISVSPSIMEVSPLIGSSPDITLENMPKIPKTLTVTQIRKESPSLSKTVSASEISLTITRQNCQTPVASQISSPALDIFPS